VFENKIFIIKDMLKIMQPNKKGFKTDKLCLLFLIVICFSTSCKTNKQNIIPQIKTDWSLIVGSKLDERYVKYKENYDTLCKQKRGFEFDLSRKHRVLKSIDFDKHIRKIVSKYRETTFDSIVTINLFDHGFQEVEYPSYATDFVVYKNNKLLKMGYVSEHDGNIFLKEYMAKSERKSLLKTISKIDGCEFGIIVICNLDNNLKIFSSEIIINPNDIYNFNVAQRESGN